MGVREGDVVPPRRLDLRRAAVVWKAGRIFSVSLPIAAVVFAVPGHSWHERIVGAAVLTAIWVASIGIGDLLSRPWLRALGPQVPVGFGVLIAVAVTAAMSAVLPGEQLSALAICLLALTVFIVATAWETFALRELRPAVRLLLIGGIGRAATLLRDLPSGGGYELIGVVDGEALDEPDPQTPLRSHLSQLASVIAEQRPDLVILAPGSRTPPTISHLLDAAEAGFRVVTLAEFYEYAFGRVPIDDLSHDWFMSILHLYQRPYARGVKRGLDLVGASFLLLLTLPLFPLLALFVKQTDGPLIFRQARLGEHGRLFTIYKFRTMRADAESGGAAVWASADDPRLTRAGELMRKLRLDELPQLFNVLRGEMSLVGPRPERPEFLAELSNRVPFWMRRHLIKPGLTGWAQVRQGYAASAEETATKLSYDLWYLRHRSFTVDLAILLRTLGVVLHGEMSAGRHNAPAPAADIDPYAELRHRALATLGSNEERVLQLPVPHLQNPGPSGVETTRGVGEAGH